MQLGHGVQHLVDVFALDRVNERRGVVRVAIDAVRACEDDEIARMHEVADYGRRLVVIHALDNMMLRRFAVFCKLHFADLVHAHGIVVVYDRNRALLRAAQ